MAFLFTGTRSSETPPTGIVRFSSRFQFSFSCGNVWFTWFIDESREWEEAVRDGGRAPRARHREAAGRSIAVPSIGTQNLPVRLATAVAAAWRRRDASGLGATSGAVLARLGRRAGTGPPPGMVLTCTRTADSNRKALKASFQRADYQSAEFRRRESNPRPRDYESRALSN